MASITGLKKISATSIDNSGEFRLGTTLDSGTTGQTILSNGINNAVSWGTAIGPVANALTAGTNLAYTSGNPSWDGTIADTLNATDTTYSAGAGINLAATTFTTDNDGTTINNSGGTGAQNQVLKVPQTLTINGTAYDGSVARVFTLPTAPIPNADLANSTIILGSTSCALGSTTTTIDDLELADCQGITMDGANIDVDCNDIDNLKDLTYCAGGSTLEGGGGAGDETVATYLDLTSATNLFPNPYPHAVLPYLVFASYDPATATSQTLTTSFVQLFSGGLSSAFVAAGVAVEVELKIMHYGGSSNRWLYLGLLDGAGTTEWTQSMGSGGGYGTGSANTERLVHYRDETDGQYQTMSWVLTGLTPGNTYTINPSVKTNTTSNYVYAGGRAPSTAFPACVLKVSQI